MGFTVEQDCPQCGAPVDIDEADHLFECPFCKVRSYFFTPDHFRFVLPCKTREKEIIYVPYLRFKGTLYFCIGDTVDNKLVDITELGSLTTGLPPSLGVKPQTVRMKFVTPDIKGSFLAFDADPKQIIGERIKKLHKVGKGGITAERRHDYHESRALASSENQLVAGFKGLQKDIKSWHEEIGTPFDNKIGHNKMHYHEEIGEIFSFLYSPMYVENDMLFDAVTDSPVRTVSPDEHLFENATNDPGWKLNMLPVLCPKCGWDLKGRSNSAVLVCTNCDTAWAASDDKFEQIDISRIPGKNSNTTYLPFWRITVESEDFGIQSYADFARIDRTLLDVQDRLIGDMNFLIPAFRMAPKMFLTMSKRITEGQFAYPSPETEFHIDDPYPVTFPKSEAIQSIKSVMAEASSKYGRMKLFSKLQKGEFSIKNTDIIYLPFNDLGSELAPQYTSSLSLTKESLGLATTAAIIPEESPKEDIGPISCPLCGEEVKSSSTHCPYCGIKIQI